MGTEKNKFSEIENFSELYDFLKGKEYRHSYYFHYTKLDTVEKILKNRIFWLSSTKNFNDKIDSRQFDDDNLYYSLCFSTGENENLPLWYLYGSLDGTGGRLRLTRAQIGKLVENGEYRLCLLSDNGLEPIMDLQLNKTMEREFRDILYCKEAENLISLKYNNSVNYNLTHKEFEKYQQHNKGFLKGLIWYYEKETRLLVKLINEAADKVKQCVNTDIRFVVTLGIPDKVYKSMKIHCGPQIQSIEELAKENYPFINKFLQDTSSVRLSDYSGTIDMRLCDKCSKQPKTSI